MRSWLDEAPGETQALVSVVDTWTAEARRLSAEDAGEAPAVTHGILEVAVKWASKRSGAHLDRAEERMLQLVAAAPDASPTVADSIRRAYVLFFEATGRLNRQVDVRAEAGELSGRHLTAAYHELQECVEALEPAIGDELRKAEIAMGA